MFIATAIPNISLLSTIIKKIDFKKKDANREIHYTITSISAMHSIARKDMKEVEQKHQNREI